MVNYDYLLKPNLTTKFFSSETKLKLSSVDSVKLFDSSNQLASNVVMASFPPKENVPYVLYGDNWQWGKEVQELEKTENPQTAVENLPVNNIVATSVIPIAEERTKIIAKTPTETATSETEQGTEKRGSAEEMLTGVGKLLTDVPGAEAADGSKQGKAGGTILNLLLILFVLLFIVVVYILLHPLQLYAKLVKFFSKKKQTKETTELNREEIPNNVLNDNEEQKTE